MSEINLDQVALDARNERLHFELDVNKQQAAAHAEDIFTVMGKDPPMPQEGDTLKVTYDVWLSYFGTVEARLSAIASLLDVPDLVHRVSLDELQCGHSILVNVVRQIETLQRKMGANHA
jgi:hypothetical protein